MSDSLLLRLTGLTKSYEGVRALQNASFELYSGEVHALVGENGAGKSTLIKIITGAVEPDGGVIELDGRSISINSPRIAKENGIAAIYQQPVLFPELSVAENLALGLDRASFWTRVDWSARRRRAIELLDQIGAAIDHDALAGDLSMAQQQMLEIARAIGAEARVLLMDEPTASLPDHDIQKLFEVIRQLRSKGVGIVYISHRVQEVLEVADRVTVLRDGQTVETRSMGNVTEQELIRLMVGREISTMFPKRNVEPGDVVLELKDFGCIASGVTGINLSVRKGEIVGLAGLVGAGRTELARTIFGLTPADQGELLIDGRVATIKSPQQAIQYGIAYLPEDRRKHGVIGEMSITANIALALLGKNDRSKNQFFAGLDFRRERELASRYVRRFGIKTPAVFSQVSTLSGGNQQKVALSRWLATKPSLLILDEPTQGIDVGARAEIHELMMSLAEQGTAILMISSEMTEILGMSDRILVMREGRICAEMGRADATQESLLSYALGQDQENVGSAHHTQ